MAPYVHKKFQLDRMNRMNRIRIKIVMQMAIFDSKYEGKKLILYGASL